MRALLLLLFCVSSHSQVFERTLVQSLGEFHAQAAAHPPSDEQLTPLAGDLPNFSKVHDWLYRGAQPTPTGFEQLKKLGIKTVVNLREGDRKWEEDLVSKLGMRYVSIPMSALTRPKDEQVEEFLELFQDFEHYPIFVHCQRGADRTGVMVAAYRIDFDHWKLKATVREMLSFGAIQPRLIAYVHEFYQKRHPAD